MKWQQFQSNLPPKSADLADFHPILSILSIFGRRAQSGSQPVTYMLVNVCLSILSVFEEFSTSNRPTRAQNMPQIESDQNVKKQFFADNFLNIGPMTI